LADCDTTALIDRVVQFGGELRLSWPHLILDHACRVPHEIRKQLKRRRWELMRHFQAVGDIDDTQVGSSHGRDLNGRGMMAEKGQRKLTGSPSGSGDFLN